MGGVFTTYSKMLRKIYNGHRKITVVLTYVRLYVTIKNFKMNLMYLQVDRTEKIKIYYGIMVV